MKNGPLYAAWINLRQRCRNPRNPDYNLYGGRGILVGESWDCFKQFSEDMGPTYKPGLVLDRIHNDGNYERGNCRWTTRSIQNHNRRKRKISTSKYRGVHWDKKDQYWVANLKGRIRLGSFDSEIEAAKAYDRAVIETYGADARPNFPLPNPSKPGTNL